VWDTVFVLSSKLLRSLLIVVVVGATTVLLVLLREMLDKAHITLVYLMLVLVGTSVAGGRAGAALAVLSFIAFNFFLLPPYHTLRVADPRDWLVLFAFLLASLVAAEMLARAQNQATLARQRTDEIDRLSNLGAEMLSASRAEDALAGITTVLRSTLGLGSCEVYSAPADASACRLVSRSVAADATERGASRSDEMFDYIVRKNAIAIERVDGAVHVIESNGGVENEFALTQRDARVIVIPLLVRERVVGLLRLTHPDRVHLDQAQRRFMQALAHYAALGLERVRLTGEEERAAALQASVEVKDAFMAAVSHDLRTPLTTIKGIAHEMRASGDMRAAVIESEADRLNALVADLLDLSRLNAGALQLQIELNTADDLIGTALSRMAGLERSNDIEVTSTGTDVLVGRFDLAHSIRALVNIAENALKYSPAGTTVEIRALRDGDFLVIEVMDRGAGVAREDADRIFEPFVRASHAGATGGAGLGLAIAQRLAAAQGGAIRYRTREGGGSTFSLCLPAAEMS
jgi:two-component system sensor histidine kinase KdpD